MYNDFPDWKEKIKSYLVHDEAQIKGFFFDYRWLSNFSKGKCCYEGDIYLYSENAYQAAKVSPEHRKRFFFCSPSESKKIWKDLPPIDISKDDWDKRKYDVMFDIVVSKFLFNKDLRQKLIDTGNRYLEETNHWHDNFYGYCICERCKDKIHQNMLGKILMLNRTFYQNNK